MVPRLPVYPREATCSIGDYAAIGDGRTVALVARDGSVDWLCLPDLDSPSVFAAVLDADRGGRFALQPEIPAQVQRRYLPDTNVLETTFITEQGAVKVTDAMALPSADLGPTRELIRRVDGLSGRVPMRWRITPAFGYGAASPRIERRGRVPVAFAGPDALAVCSWEAGEAQIDDAGDLWPLRGTSVQLGGDRAVRRPPGAAGVPAARTRRGAAGSDDRLLAALGRAPRLRRAVARRRDPQRAGAQAALPRPLRRDRGSGDRLAAGGDRRRAQLGLPLLLGAGLCLHARGPAAARLPAARPRRSSGGCCTRRSSPTRACRSSTASTAASAQPSARCSWTATAARARSGSATTPPAQTQLDIYGDLLQTALIYTEAGGRLDRETGRRLAGIADLVCRIWRQPDSGIWEVRSQPAQFTHSKMMCWVALDRALRLCDAGHIPARPRSDVAA